MCCILSKEPVSKFISATNQEAYLNSKGFFIMECLITKQNFYRKMCFYVDYYPLFESEPLYMAIVADNYIYKHIQKNTTSFHIYKKWDGVFGSNERRKKLPLPKTERLWNDLEYFKKVSQMVKAHNFRVQPYYEIKLTGNEVSHNE